MSVRILDCTTPASLGVEVHTPASTFQLVVLRDVWDRIYYASRKPDGKWNQMFPVVKPERFGDVPRTPAQLREWAQRFVANDVIAVST